MNRTLWRVIVVAGLLGGWGAAAMSCGGHPRGVTGEPTIDVNNKDLQANQRIKALEKLWQEASADTSRLPVARDASKDMLWKGKAPINLRQRALQLLLTDTSEAGMADTRHFLLLRMPTETAWPLVVDICKAIQDRAGDASWKIETASLVRSYARVVPVPPDADRPERSALLALQPGQDMAAIAFDVYVHPAENGAPKVPSDAVERARESAWELLSRLDPDGTRREVLASGTASDDPAVRDINRCARELGVVPITGSELAWVRRLMDNKDKRNGAWWADVTRLVATLTPEQKRGLRLRHLEPLRWASTNHSDWVGQSREQLLAMLGAQLGGRQVWLKAEGGGMRGEKSKETLHDWAGQLVWGDLLSILVLDEAIHQRGVVLELFNQAARDRADTSTEYGGVIWAVEEGGAPPDKDGKFALRGYQPRATERKDDRTFMAPEEMFIDSSRSLAHYHFHVQTVNNRDYAGPGRGDLDYATTHGRNCLVFTSVREGVMDADYYQSGGVVIDLGEVAIGK